MGFVQVGVRFTPGALRGTGKLNAKPEIVSNTASGSPQAERMI